MRLTHNLAAHSPSRQLVPGTYFLEMPSLFQDVHSISEWPNRRNTANAVRMLKKGYEKNSSLTVYAFFSRENALFPDAIPWRPFRCVLMRKCDFRCIQASFRPLKPHLKNLRNPVARVEVVSRASRICLYLPSDNPFKRPG